MNERELQDFLSKGDNAPSETPRQRARDGLPIEWTKEYERLYTGESAPYGKGSTVAYTPTRKESK